MSRSFLIALLFLCLFCITVSLVQARELSHLERWLRLDPVLQQRVFDKIAAADEKAVDGSGEVLSAMSFIEHEVCEKGILHMWHTLKTVDRCGDEELRAKAARRACKDGGLKPGDVLLKSCIARLSSKCEVLFSFTTGHTVSTLCDMIGLTTPEAKRGKQPKQKKVALEAEKSGDSEL